VSTAAKGADRKDPAKDGTEGNSMKKFVEPDSELVSAQVLKLTSTTLKLVRFATAHV
jgi:hypothetical protein